LTETFPTGIEFLDKQIGGFPPGFIIFYENAGAGGREFAATSMFNNFGKFSIQYLSVSKPSDVVKTELKKIFPERGEETALEIVSLADFYFKDTLVPLKWVSDRKMAIELLKGEKNVFTKLVEFFDIVEPGSYIFIDSLTDLARAATTRFGWEDLVDLLKGLRVLCVKKNLLVTTLLTAEVFEKGREEELLDQADGIVVFEWVVEKDSITRWMYFRKFTGLLPKLEKERIMKYNVRIDPAIGFTISRVMRVI
jgi:KaiC/GvpD/RAD55 family RecA-like ATPase